MLKKVFAAAISMATAVLACASMTQFAYADNSVNATANSKAEVESTIREENHDESNADVRDIICFDDGVTLTTAEGETVIVGSGEHIYIVDKNEANQMFRIYVPKANRVLYLDADSASNATIVSKNDGLVIGDINIDGRIDASDLVLVKRGLLYGWEDTVTYSMADWNGDGKTRTSDMVLMRRWLLGDL